MYRKLLRLFFAISFYLGIINLFYWLNKKKQCILVFHHIIPDNLVNDSFEQKIVCTPQNKFRSLISIVNKRFKVTTALGEPGSAIISFDDGYRAALTAVNVLDTYGNKAYFFIPLDNVDGGPLWIDLIMAWFAYAPTGTYKVLGKNVTLGSQQQRLQLFSKTIDSLYRFYDKQQLLDSLDDAFPFTKLSIESTYFECRFQGLTQEELKLLKTKGFKIGGHSVRHDILSMLSEAELKQDFNECSKQIGILFNTNLYAYPFGHFRDVNKKVVDACKTSDFSLAVLNEYNTVVNRYMLSRLNISHYHFRYEIEAALSGFMQWTKNIVRWRK